MSDGLEKIEAQYQKKMENSMSSLDSEFLRHMQLSYFKCGAKCCDDAEAPTTSVQRCIERCEAPLNQAQNSIQTEISSIHARVQQCSNECVNRAQDKIKYDQSQDDITAAKAETLKCCKDCIEVQLSTALPAMMNRLRSKLKDLKSQQLQMLA